jgi:hypothetical protein
MQIRRGYARFIRGDAVRGKEERAGPVSTGCGRLTRKGSKLMGKSLHLDHVKFEGPATYRIIVRGFLDERMSDRLAGMRITSESRGAQKPVSYLVGRLRDQAELSGVLNTLYNMHLSILSVEVQDDEKGSKS